MISVNITTFNRPEFLDRCLTSLTPSHKLVKEIIIVDDCSSTDYSEVIKKHKENLPITYLKHNKNKGNAVSRNTALQNSKQPYISFMDDDDYAEPQKYDAVMSYLENDFDFIFTAVKRIFRDGFKETEYAFFDQTQLLDDILARNSIIYSPSVIVSRQLMNEVGGFDTAIPKGVDSFFYRKILTHRELKVGYSEVPTTVIDEVNENSMTRRNDRKNHARSIKSQYQNIKYFYKYYSIRHILIRFKLLLAAIYKYIVCY